MRLLRTLLKIFAYLYHAALILFLLAISGLAISSGFQKLNFNMLPWTGDTLIFVLFFGSLFGLLSLILAIADRMPFLFFLWALVVAVLLVKGYVFSGYYFARGEFSTAVWLLAGSLVALVGAWPMRKRPKY